MLIIEKPSMGLGEYILDQFKRRAIIPLGAEILDFGTAGPPSPGSRPPRNTKYGKRYAKALAEGQLPLRKFWVKVPALRHNPEDTPCGHPIRCRRCGIKLYCTVCSPYPNIYENISEEATTCISCHFNLSRTRFGRHHSLRFRTDDHVGKLIAGNRIIFGVIQPIPVSHYRGWDWEGIPLPKTERGRHLDSIPAWWRQKIIREKLYPVKWDRSWRAFENSIEWEKESDLIGGHRNIEELVNFSLQPATINQCSDRCNYRYPI